MPTPSDTQPMQCPKCGYYSGDDWSQCGNWCPMPYHPATKFHNLSMEKIRELFGVVSMMEMSGFDLIEVDSPEHKDGFWSVTGRFLDRGSPEGNDWTLSMEWSPNKGFGIYHSDACFGESPAVWFDTPEQAMNALIQQTHATELDRMIPFFQPELNQDT